MDNVTEKEKKSHRRTTIILGLIVTIIMIYAAAPAYGVIRDQYAEDSVFILNSSVPNMQEYRPTRSFISTIFNYFFPPEEVPVDFGDKESIKQTIDLKGKVSYSDLTPYQYGKIELRSEPRYTTTDKEGYFLFDNVEVGEHTVSVISNTGAVLAKCSVDIERSSDLNAATLVRLPNGSFVFQVAVNIKSLEISVKLERNSNNEIIGIQDIILGEYEILPEDETDEDQENNPDAGAGGNNGGGGSAGPNNPPETNTMNVYDSNSTKYKKSGTAQIDIFGSSDLIAPGKSGIYKFSIDNSINNEEVDYRITFTGKTLPANKDIPIVYRLKANGSYVAGSENKWCTPTELLQYKAISAKSCDKYILEWKWPFGENDNEFAERADNSGKQYAYSLLIKVSAE